MLETNWQGILILLKKIRVRKQINSIFSADITQNEISNIIELLHAKFSLDTYGFYSLLLEKDLSSYAPSFDKTFSKVFV